MEISVDMCLAGRDLTEPKPSPDGTTVAFAVRWGSNAALAVVPITGGPERLVSTEPQPSPGRGLGGGCFDWMPDGSGLVYAARDGDLWHQPVPGGAARRISAVGEGRGTTGPGRAYQQALHGGWGQLDVDDTAAILGHSHRVGWSSAARTVMMGGSSGGLTALGVLGRHRGLAAGGVVLYPVTDLAVLAERSHRFEAHYAVTLIGPPEQTELYAERSPLSYCEQIEVPLLVFHGDADPVVPLASTLEIVDRMRVAGRDVELIVMEGEGHGFRDPVNQRVEYERIGEHLTRVVDGA